MPVPGGQLSVWSKDLGGAQPPAWMIELAEQVGMIEAEVLTAGALLPMGVIVGSAVIERCEEVAGGPLPVAAEKPGPAMAATYQWHLTDVRRARRPRKPKGHPQPVWFQPF